MSIVCHSTCVDSVQYFELVSIQVIAAASAAYLSLWFFQQFVGENHLINQSIGGVGVGMIIITIHHTTLYFRPKGST